MWGRIAIATAGAGAVAGAVLTRRDGTLLEPTGLRASPTASRLPPTDKRVCGGVVDAIGNTPLIEIHSLSAATGCRIVGKAEWMNPGGSIKDRPALYLVEAAEQSGQLKSGGTIVEATGGNTGIGLALVAAAKGYKCVFTHPETIAAEKVATMRLLGATTVACPSVPITDLRHYYHQATAIAAKTDNAAAVMQFENTASAQSHYETTAPEILRQTGGRVDAFCASAGTGGTIGGVARFLKEHRPACQVWLVDPEGSALSGAVRERLRGGSPGTVVTMVGGSGLRLLDKPAGGTIAEGVGTDRKTANFALALDAGLVDGEIVVTDQEIVDMGYHLLRNDGIFVGPSAAMNVVGALKVARQLGPGHTVATVLCDGGDRYRTKMYDPEFLKNKGLTPTPLRL